jgi:tRNA pseudouridine55 synthase
LLFGRATRLATFIDGDPKVYDATVQFGMETDTDDLTGIAGRSAPVPSADAILGALPGLTGELEQIPPSYSAKHILGAGGRAYAAARRGERVTLPSSRVVVYRWDIRALRADAADVTVTCGTGTYVRALARDLGRATGSAAHLVALRRTRVGEFDVAQAHALTDIMGTDTPPSIRTLRVVADRE